MGTNFAVLLQEPLDINQQTLAFLSVYCTFCFMVNFKNYGTQRIRFMYHVWSKWEAAILWLPFGRKIKRNCVNLLTAQQPQNSPVRLSTYHALELPHTGPTTDHACTNTNIQSQMFETINLLYLSVYITNYEINKMPTRLWIHNDLYTSTKFFNR